MSYEKINFQPFDTLTAEQMNAIQDAIIEHNSDTNNPHNVTAEQIGGTKIKTGSYVGTGNYGSSNKNTLTLDFDVKYLYIALREDDNFGYPSHAVILPNVGYGIFYYSDDLGGGLDTIGVTSHTLSTTKNGNTVSWYSDNARSQFNLSGFTYNYVAIG